MERERIAMTIQQVKSAPFSPDARKKVGQFGWGNPKEIDDIYRDSSEERRKKKEEEKNNF